MAGLVIAHDDAVAPRAWAGLGIVACASFVTSLDALVLYVAFGAIHRDFPHIGAPALSWIFSGYTIVVAAGVIAARWLADRLGLRRVFLGARRPVRGCPTPSERCWSRPRSSSLPSHSFNPAHGDGRAPGPSEHSSAVS